MKQTKRHYEGDDIAQWSNENKYHSTASHAFKGADYAQSIERDPDVSDMSRFIGELLWFGVPLITLATIISILILKFVGVL
jgi:hypothetical protein